MELVRGFDDHHTYFINYAGDLIRYNLFNKQYAIVFETVLTSTIQRYYASKENRIIVGKRFYLYEHETYWNDALLKNINYDKFLMINKGYVVDIKQRKICDMDRRIISTLTLPLFDVSNNGKRIVFRHRKKLYVQDLIDIKDLFRTSNKIRTAKLYDTDGNIMYVRRKDKYSSLIWIKDSNLILINQMIVLDLNNRREIRIIEKPIFVFSVRGMIVAIYHGLIAIYDDDVIFKISTTMCFWNYHSGLDILIRERMDYYRIKKIGNEYELKLVTIGVDYFDEYGGVPKMVQIVMEIFVIFCDLVQDILRTELYQAILVYFSH